MGWGSVIRGASAAASGSLSGGAIAGIVIGSIIGFGLLIGILSVIIPYCCDKCDTSSVQPQTVQVVKHSGNSQGMSNPAVPR
ncbi:hypothetical protein KP79_PYT00058 [Mizuhopecten yessoensis]|uniref:Uncharacterized protein n=1 Tax=Mizuhopecten yessoensis TaxID=6573 RepID=A0A210R5X0_MIZYE|nr:hypothetical protein KP79_PYT00058 [Mizuhopecten yessoensis]